MRTNVLFLFGAGASYGSLDCIPSVPPVGNGLFKELQAMGGVASTIKGALADQFRRDFEAGMDQFFRLRQIDVLSFLREMSLYFSKFEPGSANVYTKLIRSLDLSKYNVTLATTNYELLIEMAAGNLGMGVSYDNFAHYPITLNVLKLHGSINFLPDLGSIIVRGGHFIIEKAPQASVLGAPIKVARTIQEIRQFCQSDTPFAPAVAIYAPNKWVPICRTFIEQQQEYWKTAVYRASQIFVVGSGVHERDSHVWEPLARSFGYLTYVGPSADDFGRWAKDNNRSAADTNIISLPFAQALSTIEKQLS